MDPIILEKFYKNTNITNSCWNWIGPLNRYGSPIFRVGTATKNGKEYSARRISLQIKGSILLINTPVLFTCDNKLCVNPDHLIYGDEARFLSKIYKLNEENGCWIWTGPLDKNGYGKFTFKQNEKRIDVRAHRQSFELRYGIKLSHATLVCHKCDNPKCVNPEHLFIGSAKDNAEDRDNKGRGLKGTKKDKEFCDKLSFNKRGEKHHNAKLTEYNVKDILKLLPNNKVSYIAQLYSVSIQTIYLIKYKISWKHLS